MFFSTDNLGRPLDPKVVELKVKTLLRVCELYDSEKDSCFFKLLKFLPIARNEGAVVRYEFLYVFDVPRDYTKLTPL